MIQYYYLIYGLYSNFAICSNNFLFILTNVCLEAFFFFPQPEKGSLRESANSKMCLSVRPLPPWREPQMQGWSSETEHTPKFPAGPPHSTSSPPRAQGPGCRTHSLAPSAPLAAGPRGLGGGWGDALPEGTAGPASHSTWPMRWALKRVQPGGLGGPAHPMGRGETAAGAPSNMPPPTRHDCLPPPRQPLTLRSDIPCGEGVGS